MPRNNPRPQQPTFVPDAVSFILSAKNEGMAVFAVVSSKVAYLFPQLVRSLEKGGVPVIPWSDGEKNKTARSKERLEAELVRLGVDRHSVLAAIGGGTLLDLAGFTAATLMRGIGWIAVPTTLLAMADASMGGKTGVNTACGKNLVGAFHYPLEIAVWVPFLRTLPAREKRNGLAECLKHGLIADEDHYLSALNADLSDERRMGRLIRDSQRIKTSFLRKDPFDERGERNALNFGHTVGHGLEKLSGYKLSHGEAVLLGMAWETAASFADGYCGRAAFRQVREELFTARGKKTATNMDVSSLWQCMSADKKRRGKELFYVPLKQAGEPALDPPFVAPLRFDVFRRSYKLLVKG